MVCQQLLQLTQHAARQQRLTIGLAAACLPLRFWRRSCCSLQSGCSSAVASSRLVDSCTLLSWQCAVRRRSLAVCAPGAVSSCALPSTLIGSSSCCVVVSLRDCRLTCPAAAELPTSGLNLSWLSCSPARWTWMACCRPCAHEISGRPGKGCVSAEPGNGCLRLSTDKQQGCQLGSKSAKSCQRTWSI